MRTFVLGDIHGAWKAMDQCLHRAGFDPEEDFLVFLGDVADGWPGVYHCMEAFLGMKHLIFLLGNHDIWFREWLRSGQKTDHWLSQGGHATIKSYPDRTEKVDTHLGLLESALPFYEDHEGRLFVHAGFTHDRPVELTEDPDNDYYWSREIYRRSFHQSIQPDRYREIFIGHTPTLSISNRPVHQHNVWLMDQGAGWNGFLSMMDIDSGDIYQSDRVTDLYPNDPGRIDFSPDLI